MNSYLRLLTATVGAVFVLILAVSGQPVSGQIVRLDGALASAESSRLTVPDWIVRRSDNICGLKNARQLSNPGKVDFSSLYDSTPEAKKIKRDKIDPASPEGSQLRAAAFERIRKACEQVMNDRSLCSVWKSIRSRSGKSAQDVTEAVRGLL